MGNLSLLLMVVIKVSQVGERPPSNKSVDHNQHFYQIQFHQLLTVDP